MEDANIVALYWQRDQGAITASDEKYGTLCHSLSFNILQTHEDAEECVPAVPSAEEQWETEEIGAAVERWLRQQRDQDRRLFVGRYFYGAAVRDLAAATGSSPNGTTQRLRRLRNSLRRALEQEGVTL